MVAALSAANPMTLELANALRQVRLLFRTWVVLRLGVFISRGERTCVPGCRSLTGKELANFVGDSLSRWGSPVTRSFEFRMRQRTFRCAGWNGYGHLSLTWDEVIWATMTVGKARRDVLRHGRYSSADLVHRIACRYAYFDIRGGQMVRSPAFKTMDPSEEAIASSYLGMAMAKLYADKVLGIPWLMHISRYEAAWAVKYGASAKRPDLFGCNPAGDWAVAEAKGRDRVTGAFVTEQQEQKSSVATINGAAPTHRYGAATRFQEGRLALRIVDPPSRHDAQAVPIDPAAWLVDYCTPIVDLSA